MNLGDALYCINFLWSRLERNVNNFDILHSVKYLSLKDEGDRRNSCKIYFHPKCIRVRTVNRLYKTSVSVLDMLHVVTRGNGNSGSVVKFNCVSTTNQMSFKP
jgi:hypothetical protein